MATYYVSPVGSNTSPYDTWAKAANLASTIVALNPAGGPHTIYIAPGTYTNQISLTNAAWAGVTLQGTSAVGSLNLASFGQVSFTQAGANITLRVSVDNAIVRGLSATQTGTAQVLYLSGDGCVLSHLLIFDAPYRAIDIYDSNSTIQYTKVTGQSDASSNVFRIGGDSNATINYCIAVPSENNNLAGIGVYVANTAVVAMNNCIILGLGGNALEQRSTGSLTVKNSIIGGFTTQSNYIAVKTAGALHLSNNLYVPDWGSNHRLYSGAADTDSNNRKTDPANFIRLRSFGYITPRIDDAANLAYALQVESALSSRGMKGQYYVEARYLIAQPISNVTDNGAGLIRIGTRNPHIVETGDTVTIASVTGTTEANGTWTATYVDTSNFDLQGSSFVNAYVSGGTYLDDSLVSAIQGIVDRGVLAVGCHSRGHANLSLSGNALTITKAEKTVEIDLVGDQLIVSDTVTITGLKAKSYAQIYYELNAAGVTTSDVNIGNSCLGESLDTSSGAQASPYTAQFLIDSTGNSGYFKVEIKDAKAIMESVLTGFTAKSFATPGGLSQEDAETAIKTVGFICNANTSSTRYNYDLRSINAYQFYGPAGSSFVDDASDSNTTAYAHFLAETAAQLGYYVQILTHTTADITIAQWGLILDALAQYSEIMVTSADEVAEALIASWTTGDNITYETTLTDQANYSLKGNSICRDRGANVSLTNDFEGKPVPMGSAPDIGAYEVPVPSPIGLNLDLGGGGRMIPPRRRRR